MLTSTDLKSNSWTAADYVFSVAMQKYCMDDAKITMKLAKNRAYGPVGPTPNIIAAGAITMNGAPWWQVNVSRTAAKWIKDLGDDRLFEQEENLFNMPEDIYILTKLKWA